MKLKKMTKKQKKYSESGYKTYSLDTSRVEDLKKILTDNDIKYRSDADAIYRAIDKYILDFKLKNVLLQKPTVED